MSTVKVVIEQPTTKVYMDRNSVVVSQYTGQPVYPEINAQSPITYNSASLTVGLNQGAISISNNQVTGLGTAATRNIPSSGNAEDNEVVLGNDTRLTSDGHMPFGIVTDVSGHYLVSMGSGPVNQLFPAGTFLYAPMYLSNDANIDRIVIEVATSASEFGNVRLGIYDSNGKGLPGSLIVDAGTVNASTVGIKQVIVDEIIDGLVWIAVLIQGGAVSLKSFTNTVQAYPSMTTGATSAGRLTLADPNPLYGVLPTVAGGSPTGAPYYPPLVNLRMR
jgi:hypothetical protein